MGGQGSSPGLGRSPGEANGNPLQYSFPQNSMDKGDQQATVHGVAESDTTEQLTLSLQCRQYAWHVAGIPQTSSCYYLSRLPQAARHPSIRPGPQTRACIFIFWAPGALLPHLALPFHPSIHYLLEYSAACQACNWAAGTGK